MTSPITDYLEAVLRDCRNSDGGEVLTGNRILSEADPDVFSVAVVTVEGTVYCAGDVDSSFSIQSISKALTYALALADRGLDAVHRKIDVEPSGDAFNEISLERDTGRPRNALINAGAIAAHSLVEGVTSSIASTGSSRCTPRSSAATSRSTTTCSTPRWSRATGTWRSPTCSPR